MARKKTGLVPGPLGMLDFPGQTYLVDPEDMKAPEVDKTSGRSADTKAACPHKVTLDLGYGSRRVRYCAHCGGLRVKSLWHPPGDTTLTRDMLLRRVTT